MSHGDGASPKEPLASTSQEVVQRDDTFYLNYDFITLKVENRLFRVPKSPFLKQSKFFVNLFRSRKGKGMKGWSEDNPMDIHHVTAEEFRHFLSVLLPTVSSSLTDIWESQLPAAEEVWISVLKLSTLWSCLEMRELAIKRIDATIISRWAPARLVLFGRRYLVDSWVRIGYRIFVIRNGAISDQEASEIGPLQCLRLMRLRESLPKNFSPFNLDAEIQGAFRDELQKLVAKQKALPSRKD